MLIHSASQLLTITGSPQRGQNLGSLGIIENGAVLVRGEKIVDTGTTSDLIKKYPAEDLLDANGKAVLPGFVDPHTHLVWAGDRAAEFEIRLIGKSYLEIMASGGGIASTVHATRTSLESELFEQSRSRTRAMFRFGTTSAEAKTGYGLELATELRQLNVLLRLDTEGPLEVSPTFLGAHAVPEEYRNHPNDYVSLLCEVLMPELKSWWKSHAGQRPLPFIDVFCEKGAFDLVQSKAILTTAKQLGFPLKAHVDEFENLGGAALAAELGAVSVDHFVKTSPAEIESLGRSNTAVVSLPCTPFGLAEPHYSPARELIMANAILALATDLNPGTAWCESMQFVIALACRYLKLTPAQAIAAATINAAYAIQRDTQVGSIEPGKQADLLILSVPDYRQLAYRFGGNLVDTVIKKGVVHRFV
jgi:imidazolonepropionase